MQIEVTQILWPCLSKKRCIKVLFAKGRREITYSHFLKKKVRIWQVANKRWNLEFIITRHGKHEQFTWVQKLIVQIHWGDSEKPLSQAHQTQTLKVCVRIIVTVCFPCSALFPRHSLMTQCQKYWTQSLTEKMKKSLDTRNMVYFYLFSCVSSTLW